MQCSGKAMSLDSHEICQISQNLLYFVKSTRFHMKSTEFHEYELLHDHQV